MTNTATNEDSYRFEAVLSTIMDWIFFSSLPAFQTCVPQTFSLEL